MTYVASARSASRQITISGHHQPDRAGRGRRHAGARAPAGRKAGPQPKNTSTSFIASTESTAATSSNAPAREQAEPADARERLVQSRGEERDDRGSGSGPAAAGRSLPGAAAAPLRGAGGARSRAPRRAAPEVPVRRDRACGCRPRPRGRSRPPPTRTRGCRPRTASGRSASRRSRCPSRPRLSTTGANGTSGRRNAPCP